MSFLILSFARRPLPQLPTLDIMSVECKQLPNFPIGNKSALHIWCRNWNSSKNGIVKNATAATSKKNATLLKRRLRHGCFLAKFRNYFSPVTLSKTRLQHRCFTANSAKFLRKLILQNICRGLLLMIIARFFFMICLSLKLEIK